MLRSKLHYQKGFDCIFFFMQGCAAVPSTSRLALFRVDIAGRVPERVRVSGDVRSERPSRTTSACLQSRFAKVNFHTILSTYPLYK
jgi:hypothetical protein